jgi:hypothetical protein
MTVRNAPIVALAAILVALAAAVLVHPQQDPTPVA